MHIKSIRNQNKTKFESGEIDYSIYKENIETFLLLQLSYSLRTLTIIPVHRFLSIANLSSSMEVIPDHFFLFFFNMILGGFLHSLPFLL